MKKIWKRLLSAGLVIALVITMVNIIPRNNAMDVTYAAEASNGVFRGVVNSLDELPQYRDSSYLGLPRGTVNHPFVVLEIVPYEEYAEFGYLISGCEPVDVERMRGNSEYMNLVGSIAKGSVSVKQENAFCFFLDEPQATWDRSLWSNPQEISISYGIYGYYEYVSEGGLFGYKYIGEDETDNNVSSGDLSSFSDDVEVNDEIVDSDDVVETENEENTQAGAPIQTPEAEEAEYGEEQEPTEREEQPIQDDLTPDQGDLTPEVEPTDEPNDGSEGSATEEVSYRNQNILVKTSETNEIEIPSEDASQEETSSSNETTPSVDNNDDNESIQNGTSVSDEDTPAGEETSTDDTLEDDALENPPLQDESLQDEMESSDETWNTEQQEEEPYDEIALLDLEPETEESVTSQWKVVRAKDGNGFLVWHTITNAERKRLENSGVDFTASIDNRLPQKVGDRLYTIRETETGELVLQVDHYFDYVHNDDFLKRSLNLSDAAAENYSIVVKTITLDQLNATPAWIDYADLIYLACQTHAGEENLRDMWLNMNRLGRKDPTNPTDNYELSNTMQYIYDHDINWEVALKMYNKVTADTNFAAMIYEDNIFIELPKTEGGKSVSTIVYNWNLEPATNIYGKQCDLYSATGCDANLYKLYVMLMCMDPNLFKSIYIDGGYITKNNDGDLVVTLQTGEAATYWRPETFMLAPDNIYPSPYSSIQKYWTNECWDSFHYGTEERTTTSKDWCMGHFFTFNGALQFSQLFTGGLLTKLDYFPDFAAALKEYGKSSPAEAVRYILGDQPNSDYYGYGLTANILDLEPSVGLNADGTPNWYLKESYVRMMLPHFKGNIQITHQTTAEFIGRIEDLNTTYDLIFMGLDYSAYNTTHRQIQIGNNWVDGDWPDWNDNSLDGMIYLHTGDSMVSAEHTPSTGRNRSVKWLLQNNGNVLNSTELRFPGNDISRLKEDDLFDYLKAGYPIVVESYLYNLTSQLIDSSSYVYDFINKNREYANLLSTTSSASAIEASARNSLTSVVEFNVLPNQYNGNTSTEDSPIVTNANYLTSNELAFKFTVNPVGSAKYKYRIFVDQDRDSKFSSSEAVYTSTIVLDPKQADQSFPRTIEYAYPIDRDWVGLIQWKIEVYEVEYVYDENGNHVYNYQYGYDANGNRVVTSQTYAVTETGVRYSATGRSAMQNRGTKKQINVLQIMPKEIDPDNIYQGALDLSKDSRFTKYYHQLADYDITVNTITWAEFESYFYTLDESGNKVSRGFIYDYTRESDDMNPLNIGAIGGNLDDYNMIIMGFGDTYGGVNLSNRYGAIDYLRYYVDMGKSILFTHDLTSMYNQDAETFGYTVNALMRDLMGMNRYQSVSIRANSVENTSYPKEKWVCLNCDHVHNNGTENNPPNKCEVCGNKDSLVWFRNESTMLRAYQSENASSYDWLNSNATHGYTYYTMKRLGWNNTADNSGGGVMPFRYTIVNPKGLSVTTAQQHGQSTGFNNNNDLTTRVTMVNEGQITNYPYHIGEVLTVAPTHGQWYALSPEDPEVTVWYSLAGDPASVNTSDGGNDGSSIIYAVSPNDAMNNYYIYSKGNIFYSGVGHSTVNKDMEAKLFINTMIAAYNAGYVPPSVVVTNEEAIMNGEQRYSIELMQNYDFGGLDADGYYEQLVEDFQNELYPVNFMPRDANLVSTSFECTIYFDIGTAGFIYVDRVVELNGINGDPILLADGSPKTLYADPTTHVFSNLENTKYYRIYFPKDYLSEPVHDVYFTINNDRIKTKITTILNMFALPLFPLD